jgi:hypothetical protein
LSARRFLIAFLLALAVPAWEAWRAQPIGTGPLAPLVLFPFLVLGPLPLLSGQEGVSRARFGVFSALVPLGLGLGLDLARGASPWPTSAFAASGWGTFALWCASACSPNRMRYSAAWFLLMPGLMALRLALDWAPLDAARELSASSAWCIDPWVFVHRWGRNELESGVALLLPLLTGGLVFLASRAPLGARKNVPPA